MNLGAFYEFNNFIDMKPSYTNIEHFVPLRVNKIGRYILELHRLCTPDIAVSMLVHMICKKGSSVTYLGHRYQANVQPYDFLTILDIRSVTGVGNVSEQKRTLFV